MYSIQTSPANIKYEMFFTYSVLKAKLLPVLSKFVEKKNVLWWREPKIFSFELWSVFFVSISVLQISNDLSFKFLTNTLEFFFSQHFTQSWTCWSKCIIVRHGRSLWLNSQVCISRRLSCPGAQGCLLCKFEGDTMYVVHSLWNLYISTIIRCNLIII